MSTRTENVTLEEISGVIARWQALNDEQRAAALLPLQDRGNPSVQEASHYALAVLRVADALPDLLRIARAVAVTGGVFLDDDAQEYYCNTCGERDCTKETLQHEYDCAYVLAHKLQGGAL